MRAQTISTMDKFNAIIQHQAEKPQSRTAKAWSRVFKERDSKTETARQDNTPEEPSSVSKKD